MSLPKLHRFMPRAPRYVIRPNDRHTMRFSLNNTQGPGGIENTILYNLSESGCAFLLNPGLEISVGEVIKVEIPVPNGEQIAWWGRVVRIQEFEARSWMFGKDPFKEQQKLLVGIRFEDLPEPHSRTIRKGIEDSFLKAMREQQYRNWHYYRTYALRNILQISAYILLTALAFSFLYYISRPSENYDADKGAPWGQRFK